MLKIPGLFDQEIWTKIRLHDLHKAKEKEWKIDQKSKRRILRLFKGWKILCRYFCHLVN